MATVNYTLTTPNPNQVKIVWTLSPGDDGQPVSVAPAMWRSIQAIGAGISGSDPILMESSNDGGTWHPFVGWNTSGVVNTPEDRGQLWRPRWLITGSPAGTVDVILITTIP